MKYIKEYNNVKGIKYSCERLIMRPKLIGKHPEEETYIISMDGTTNPHTPCKVARSNPKGLYGPALLGSILARFECKRIENNEILLETLLNFPVHTIRK